MKMPGTCVHICASSHNHPQHLILGGGKLSGPGYICQSCYILYTGGSSRRQLASAEPVAYQDYSLSCIQVLRRCRMRARALSSINFEQRDAEYAVGPDCACLSNTLLLLNTLQSTDVPCLQQERNSCHSYARRRSMLVLREATHCLAMPYVNADMMIQHAL